MNHARIKSNPVPGRNIHTIHGLGFYFPYYALQLFHISIFFFILGRGCASRENSASCAAEVSTRFNLRRLEIIFLGSMKLSNLRFDR